MLDRFNRFIGAALAVPLLGLEWLADNLPGMLRTYKWMFLAAAATAVLFFLGAYSLSVLAGIVAVVLFFWNAWMHGESSDPPG